jgi:4-hydroxy-tetrahydrodipicolinate reductase
MLRVLVVGLGPIGIACARAVGAEQDMQLVGLIDSDPAKIGKDLGALAAAAPGGSAAGGPGSVGTGAEVDQEPSPVATARIGDAVGRGGADVAIVTTTSRFERIIPTLDEALGLGLAVVSSCEEMSWPWYRHADLAGQVDARAKSAGRALLGTGVNPGFVMDSLAVVLSSMVRRVTAVRCERRVNASLRRLPLQAKVGANLKPEEFAARAQAGRMGHVGLAESAAMLAAGLGHHAAPGSVHVALDPVIAARAIPSSFGLIEPGRVAGMRSTAHWEGPGLTIDLHLTMALGLTDPADSIEVSGPVTLKLQIPGGIPGDSATVAAMLNYTRAVHAAAPGLHTMLDLPTAGCLGRDA